jgi:acyl-CoA dehydrogenase-like protein
LIPAAQKLLDEVLGPGGDESGEDGPLLEEARLVEGAKKAALLVAGSAVQKYMQALADEQEVIGVMSNLVMEVYAMESALLRTLKKIVNSSEESCSVECDTTKIYIYDAVDRMEMEARRALARIAEGDMLRTQLSMLRRFLKRTPADTIGLKRRVADRAIELGRYPF